MQVLRASVGYFFKFLNQFIKLLVLKGYQKLNFKPKNHNYEKIIDDHAMCRIRNHGIIVV